MTPNDTDPHLFARHLLDREPLDPAGEHVTRPEGCRESNALAASLLENVSDAALPTEGVSQTNGHTAAAFASQGHRPPRAHESPHDEAAVVLNTTAPLAIRNRGDESSAAVASGARGNTTARKARPASPSNRPGFRGRVALGLAFAAIAVTALVFAFSTKPQATGTSQPGAPVVLMAAEPHLASAAPSTPPSSVLSSSPAEVNAEVAAPASTYEPAEPSATTTPPPHGVTHPAPPRGGAHSTSPRRRSPRPTGTFDEPARSLD